MTESGEAPKEYPKLNWIITPEAQRILALKPSLLTPEDKESFQSRLAQYELSGSPGVMVRNHRLEVVFYAFYDNRVKEIIFQRTEDGWVFQGVNF